jgi:hypothetical protein
VAKAMKVVKLNTGTSKCAFDKIWKLLRISLLGTYIQQKEASESFQAQNWT